jgi:hypothetical protein
MNMKDDLGDRMKLYEGIEAGRRLMPPLGAVTNREAVIFDGAPSMLAEMPNVGIEPPRSGRLE